MANNDTNKASSRQSLPIINESLGNHNNSTSDIAPSSNLVATGDIPIRDGTGNITTRRPEIIVIRMAALADDRGIKSGNHPCPAYLIATIILQYYN